MAKAYILLRGGLYKREIDDGILRVPFNPVEADQFTYNVSVPSDTDNSIGELFDFNVSELKKLFCNLEAGDELFLVGLPQACSYFSMWIGGFNNVPGLKAVFDVVRMRDVWNKFASEGEITGVPSVTGSPVIEYDFSNGIGYATEDALSKALMDINDAKIAGSDVPTLFAEYDNNRNNSAYAVNKFTPCPMDVGMGEAMYIRMTITEMPDSVSEENCCIFCGKSNRPFFAVGCMYMRSCFDVFKIPETYCTCGCGCGACSEGGIEGLGGTYGIVYVMYKNAGTGALLAPTKAVKIPYGTESMTITPIAPEELGEFNTVSPEAGTVSFAEGEAMPTPVAVEFMYSFTQPQPTSVTVAVRYVDIARGGDLAPSVTEEIPVGGRKRITPIDIPTYNKPADRYVTCSAEGVPSEDPVIFFYSPQGE